EGLVEERVTVVHACCKVLDDQNFVGRRAQLPFPARINRVVIDNQPIRFAAGCYRTRLTSVSSPITSQSIVVVLRVTRECLRQQVHLVTALANQPGQVTRMRTADETTFGSGRP